MTGLKILAGVVLVLFLLGRIWLGGGVKYSQDGLYVRLRLGGFTFLVYPRKKKQEKGQGKKPSKPPEEKPEKEEKRELGGSLELVKGALPLVCEAAGELKRKIRVDTLQLELTAAAEDAAKAAMAYGWANMAMGMIWPIIEQNFEVKDVRLHTQVEFQDDSPTIYLNAALSLRLGQLVSFGMRFGWKFGRIYWQTKPRVNSKKEAI